MLVTYLVGVGLTVTAGVAWVAIQNAWRDAFSDIQPPADALAGRCRCCERQGELHPCGGSEPARQCEEDR